VLERASQLSGEENGSNLDSHSAIFCEAAMNAYTAMNKVCHQESSAGTTATVLFTKIMEDGTTRVYCANAGDSRCTMAVETKSRLKVIDLSEDHSLSNIKEVWRVEAHVEAKRCQLPCDPMKLASNNPCSTREMCAYRSEKDLRKALYRIKHLRLFWDEGMHKDAAKYHFVSCLSQNAHLTTSLDTDILDDTLHTVASYQGERSLLPLAPDHTSLHCEADDLGITVHGEVEFLKQRKGSTITATTTYSQEINVSNDGSPRSIVSRSSDLEPVEDFFLPTPESCHEEDYETLPVIKREHSFIGRRRTSCGKEGVLALFGRFNVNLTMTRSIGDKYAARSCVALPEIFSCDVAASEYARFIVASDGLWDVMTSVEAHKFIRGFADPSKAAIALATKARMFRETNKWRIDDISVIVVDVNPHLRSELGGTGCACVIS
jgi:serine/threonine protein phosphatase PrpC